MVKNQQLIRVVIRVECHKAVVSSRLIRAGSIIARNPPIFLGAIENKAAVCITGAGFTQYKVAELSIGLEWMRSAAYL